MYDVSKGGILTKMGLADASRGLPWICVTSRLSDLTQIFDSIFWLCGGKLGGFIHLLSGRGVLTKIGAQKGRLWSDEILAPHVDSVAVHIVNLVEYLSTLSHYLRRRPNVVVFVEDSRRDVAPFTDNLDGNPAVQQVRDVPTSDWMRGNTRWARRHSIGVDNGLAFFRGSIVGALAGDLARPRPLIDVLPESGLRRPSVRSRQERLTPVLVHHVRALMLEVVVDDVAHFGGDSHGSLAADAVLYRCIRLRPVTDVAMGRLRVRPVIGVVERQPLPFVGANNNSVDTPLSAKAIWRLTQAPKKPPS